MSPVINMSLVYDIRHKHLLPFSSVNITLSHGWTTYYVSSTGTDKTFPWPLAKNSLPLSTRIVPCLTRDFFSLLRT